MRFKTKRKIRQALKIAVIIIAIAATARFAPELIPDDTKEVILSVFEEKKPIGPGAADAGMKVFENLYNEYIASGDSSGSAERKAAPETIPENPQSNTGTGTPASADRLVKSGVKDTAGGLELPKSVKGHQVVSHPGYTLSYNEDYEQPDWVAYVLTVDELNTNVTGRTENFREDNSITTGSAHLTDYRNSGYDRGHLMPSADRTSSVELNDASFLMSNMSPQIHRFNAGLWLKAENAVRDAAREYGELYIATGPVFTDNMKTIGECDVAVPEKFYKVLLGQDSDGSWQSIALICPQEYSNGNLKPYLTTVNDVEKVSGLNFFPALDDRIEEQVEGTYDISRWPKVFGL